jgi:hypothetical protein
LAASTIESWHDGCSATNAFANFLFALLACREMLMRIHTSFTVAAVVIALSVPAFAQQSSQQQTQQAQTPLPIQSAAPGPIPLGVNGDLTPWLQVRGEYRTRIEGFSGGGYTSGNDDAYWLGRLRLNATVRPMKTLTFFVQAQDARAFDKTTGGLLTPLRDTLDLRQAYGEFVAVPKASTIATLRVGRQEINLGEQRLVGSANWLNNARTFDAARVILKHGTVQADAFAASVVTITPDAVARTNGISTSGYGNALYGVYGTITTVPKQSIEPYFFWRESPRVAAELGGIADLHQGTTGARVAGRLPASVDYSTEIAVQAGSVGPDSISAWAGHALVGKTYNAHAFKPRVFAEFNHASGDSNAKDGSRGTFDQLYPTGHDKLGLADQVGWRNINDARAGLDIKPMAKLLITGSYHSFWLASATDALYNAAGAVVARSVTGVAGRDVGQEADVQTTYNYSAQLQIAAGFAHLFPGTFLKTTTPGHGYSYPYVMVTYVFLGEKPAIGGKNSR